MVIAEFHLISNDLSCQRSNRLFINLLFSTDFREQSMKTSSLLRKNSFQLFCDFHGHSRQKNFFFYGNDPRLHFLGPAMGRSTITKVFPKLFTGIPGFGLQNCLFTIRKQKEGCARIVVWEEFKVDLAYTMEASYNGFDIGVYKVWIVV